MSLLAVVINCWVVKESVSQMGREEGAHIGLSVCGWAGGTCQSPVLLHSSRLKELTAKLAAPFLWTAVPFCRDLLGFRARSTKRCSEEQEARPEQCCVTSTAEIRVPDSDFLQQCQCIPVKSLLARETRPMGKSETLLGRELPMQGSCASPHWRPFITVPFGTVSSYFLLLG